MVSEEYFIIRKLKVISEKIDYASNMIAHCEELLVNMKEEGRMILKSLVSYYEGQIKGNFCGIVSPVICLKHLLPEIFKKVTQRDLYFAYVKDKFWKTKHDSYYGLSLAQVGSLVSSAAKDKINLKIVQNKSIKDLETQFRKDLKSIFEYNEKKAILINFYRNYKEHRGGHFSPIAGYSEIKGREYVYILDVAAHRSSPHWFPLKELIPLMCRFDGKQPRGYLVITRMD